MKNTVKIVALFLVVIAVVYIQYVQYKQNTAVFSKVAANEAATAALMQTKDLGDALLDYARNHIGKFPESLADMDALPESLKHYSDPTDNTLHDWIYLGGFDDSIRPPVIIAASPVLIGDERKRAVFYSDGSGQVMTDSVYQGRLHTQAKRK